MDLLFIVPSDLCLLTHKAKSRRNLTSPLPLVCGPGNTAQLHMESVQTVALAGWRHCSAQTTARRECGELDPTRHSQPTDLTRCRGNHTSWSAMPHTRQTHVGEIMVCLQPGPNPSITRRQSVPGFNDQMSTSRGKSVFRSNSAGLGKETSAAYC